MGRAVDMMLGIIESIKEILWGTCVLKDFLPTRFMPGGGRKPEKVKYGRTGSVERGSSLGA